jgi:MoaA/NifB/PqqE/SkfB family radical SAM enzyme
MVRMYTINDAYNGFKKPPAGIGAIFRGWDVPASHYRDPGKLPVVDFRAFTHKCLLDCFHCFTDKNKKTLTLGKIKDVIDQLSAIETYAINYVGEGEPTLDRDFLEVLQYTNSKGIIPVVFTEAATRMRDRGFVREVKATGASLSPKCDSLFNAGYQNWVVGGKKEKYFDQRNEAIELLMEEGFNDVLPDGATRMGLDMVVSTRNKDDVGRTLRYCRDNNIWVTFSYYLPSGRSGMENFDRSLMLPADDKRKLAEEVRRIDEAEYGYVHEAKNNFLTHGCVEYMQIYGDGRVSPCPGNETIIGNVEKDSIKDLKERLVERFPKHGRTTFDGCCLYRDRCVEGPDEAQPEVN